ncbi:CocE/NonD family hydrolase [Leptodesmis sichuanensis]|uniref:CocE/NonD family hydrolase n=1 Tax=Leptodesmis sichuanensis TaxID=2906798 RepID=UPI001F268905
MEFTMLKVQPKQTLSMVTRDRVRLDADVYRPEAEGPFPVLLMRQPYGRAIASTVVYAHPIWYAAHGYIVVIQDVRGRGTSEGDFKLFAHEILDGYDAVQWAANLPGSTGEVGMYGFSYQGMTQLYAAIAQPPALKTLCPAMIGYDLYQDWAYENRAFCLQANLGWAIQLAAETARLQGDAAAYQRLAAAAQDLPLGDAVPTRPSLLQQLAPDSFYHEWLDHPEPDEYWQQLSPKTYFQDVDLPMLHIGGWFDTFLRGTLHLYKEMADRSTYRQQLIVGPWAHLPWSRTVGALDFGPEANSPCDRLQIRWFDQFLKGIDTGLLTEPPIQLFEMGTNQWRSYPSWNTHKPLVFYLASTGLAAIDDRDGRLTQNAKCKMQNSSETIQHPTSNIQHPPDLLVHDPWRPVPARGGHAAYPSGPQERSTLDSRTDILTYTSEPLTEALHLAGEVQLHVTCTADTPSFDLHAVVSEVQPDGRVFNFTEGHIVVEAGASTNPLTLALQPTCISVQPGCAIRLSLSAACFPAYPVNAGTGSPVGKARLLDQQIITVTVHSQTGDRGSSLVFSQL